MRPCSTRADAASTSGLAGTSDTPQGNRNKNGGGIPTAVLRFRPNFPNFSSFPPNPAYTFRVAGNLGQGAKTCLSEMRSAGVTVEILSANWSQIFVEEAVKGFCDAVVANRLLFDERGYSTGEIELRVASARDKWTYFKSRRSKTGLTGYVGDSVSDLRAILEADVGLLVGENTTCLRTINRFQIPMKRVTEATRRVVNCSETRATNKRILHADSWETVNHLLKQT